MGRCPYEKLNDIEDVLIQIRSFEGIREAKPGIFYIKSQSFLHFHVEENKRWADVKIGSEWGAPIPLKFKATLVEMKKFVEQVRKRFLKSV